MNVQWIRNWRKLLRMRRIDAAFALTRWQHFSVWNDVMAAILSIRVIRNPTPSIDAYLPEEHFWQISSRSDLKRRSLSLFWRGRSNKKNNKMGRYMRSVPDLKNKICNIIYVRFFSAVKAFMLLTYWLAPYFYWNNPDNRTNVANKYIHSDIMHGCNKTLSRLAVVIAQNLTMQWWQYNAIAVTWLRKWQSTFQVRNVRQNNWRCNG